MPKNLITVIDVLRELKQEISPRLVLAADKVLWQIYKVQYRKNPYCVERNAVAYIAYPLSFKPVIESVIRDKLEEMKEGLL